MPSDSPSSDRGRKESRKRHKRDRDEDDDRDRESRRYHKSSRKSRQEHDKKKHSRKSERRKKSERSLSSDESSHGHRRRKSSKHDRKRSSRDESKKSNSSGSQKEPSKVPSKLVDIGPVQGLPPKSLLDREKDYFAYHDHLRLYLYRSEGKYFEDLSSTETHKAFAKFCAKYNRGGLEQGFYQKELPKDAIEQCKRTKHSWNFKTSAAEMKSLDVIKNGVKKQTSYDVKPPSNTVKGPMMCQHASGGLESSNRAVVAPRKVESEDQKLVSSIVQDKGKLSEQEAVLKSLGLGGLKPGQKIKIAPREM